MRTYEMELGPHKLTLATSFKANMLITERVMDPMQIARDEALFAEAQEKGRAYTPKFEMTVLNVAKMIHAGQEAAGGKLSLEEVGEIVMEVGAVNCMIEVGNYLSALVSGESQEIKPTSKKGTDTGKA